MDVENTSKTFDDSSNSTLDQNEDFFWIFIFYMHTELRLIIYLNNEQISKYVYN